MPNVKQTVIRLAAICGAAAICVSAPAAAAVPRGALSAAEYEQLSVGVAALNKSASAKSVNWAKARAACRAIGRATELLRTQRDSCLDSMTVLNALANFPPERRRCSAAGKTNTGTTTTESTTTTGSTTTTTTTTGTTTPPADSAVIQLLVCMSPHYHALVRHAKGLDKGAIVARKAALARGFGGSCLAALAPSAVDLRNAKLFASSTARLAGDVALLIKVTEGKAPSSDFDQAKVDKAVKQFESSANAVLDEHGQPKLSVCPHR